MLHLTQILGKPVVDVAGHAVGTVGDIAVTTGDIFPRVTALAFWAIGLLSCCRGENMFLLSTMRRSLSTARADLRFSYRNPTRYFWPAISSTRRS